MTIGKNNNQFLSLDETTKPIILENSSIHVPSLREAKLYDISTQKGQIITLSL